VLDLAGLVGTNITPGEHPTAHVGGLTFNVDTIWSTAVAMLVIFIFGWVLRRQATSGVPGKFQLVWETGVQIVTRQVEGSIGPRGAFVIHLAITLFVFIIICNFFEIVALGSRYEFLAVPNADINLPLAMALYVIVLVHVNSVRVRGWHGYFHHYLFQPFPVFLLPVNLFINLVEEIAKPVTLALRLFGNLFSGALMLVLISALGAWKLGSIPLGDFATLLANIAWKLFDVFLIGPIQAFIFALLTILYFDTAMTVTPEH